MPCKAEVHEFRIAFRSLREKIYTRWCCIDRLSWQGLSEHGRAVAERRAACRRKANKNMRRFRKCLPRLCDGLDQRRLAPLDDFLRAQNRWTQVLRVSNRPLGIDAHAFGDHGEVYVWIGDRGPDRSAIDAAAVAVSHALHVHDFLVIGPIVCMTLRSGMRWCAEVQRTPGAYIRSPSF
jgi:hypothetical protein